MKGDAAEVLAALAVSALTVSAGCNVGPTDVEDTSADVEEADDLDGALTSS